MAAFARKTGPLAASSLSLLLLLSLAGTSGGAAAEFYRWVDEQGHTRVSNIPPRGIRADGSLRDAYNPNSIVSQYAEMLLALRREAVEFETEMARQAALLEEKEFGSKKSRVARPAPGPAEGMMNLDQLIDLEKRGGRYLGPTGRR